MLSVRQDLLFSLRQLRRSPGFAITVVLTLALGIGSATAIFSLVNGILLRPLAFPDEDRLVGINTLEFPRGVPLTNSAAAGIINTSYVNFGDWQQTNHTFESLASWHPMRRLYSKVDGDGARVITGARVSTNLFSTLAVSPELGRNFTKEEDQFEHRVVILSHELWVTDFASSPSVLGQIVKISDVPTTVIGVMPAGFHFPIDEPAYFWTTYALENEGPIPYISLRTSNDLAVVGRLKPGVSREQARADLNTIQRGIAQQYPEDRFKAGIFMTSLLEDTIGGDVRQALLLLLTAVGVVLMIGCTNVAGLLLARASGRRPELALRTALGATRPRILRQLLIEALLLAFAGGVVGILMSFVLMQVGLGFLPKDLPRRYDVTMDARVLLFAILLSACTALIFGLLPAWKISRQEPADVLRAGASTITSGRRRNRLHHTLVVVECALGFTLLIGSGLLIRSMVNIFRIKPGFDTANTVSFDIALTNKRYADLAKVQFFKSLLPKLAELPGVLKVSSVHPLPIYTPWNSWASFTIPGHIYSEYDLPGAITSIAEPGYFETLSIPLVRGRTFTEHDNAPDSPLVAVINRTFANRFFPGRDPIGLSFVPLLKDKTPRQIIGVVADTQTGDLVEPYQPQFFLPYAQDPSHQRPLVVMKVAGDPLTYQNAVRKLVASLDKDAPVFRYQPLTTDIQDRSQQSRFEATLVSGFGALALLLSAVGLYAVLSYIVAQRTRELGLRMALGATRFEILRLVLTRGLTLALVGIGIGILTSAAVTHFISGILYRVAPLDLSVFSTVTILLLLVSFVAALAPALRAAYLDPMRTLRQQ